MSFKTDMVKTCCHLYVHSVAQIKPYLSSHLYPLFLVGLPQVTSIKAARLLDKVREPLLIVLTQVK